MKLLLIENHKAMARALRQALEEEGHTVEVARDMESGEARARFENHDVLILDLVRCKEASLAQLRRWRQAGLRVTVLALIAPDDSAAVAGGFVPEVDDYLTVPFLLQALLARLPALTHTGRGSGFRS